MPRKPTPAAPAPAPATEITAEGRKNWDALAPEAKVDLFAPYLVNDGTRNELSDRLTANDRYELARALMRHMTLADIAKLVCPAHVNRSSKAEKAAAEKIAEEYAGWRNEAKVLAEHREWLDEKDPDELAKLIDGRRDTPMAAETTAEKLNNTPFIFRDQWFSQFVARLSPTARADLGAYYKPQKPAARAIPRPEDF